MTSKWQASQHKISKLPATNECFRNILIFHKPKINIGLIRNAISKNI
jgi:hypothetical protein